MMVIDHHTTNLARREPKKYPLLTSFPCLLCSFCWQTALCEVYEDSFCVEMFWVCFGPSYVIVKFSIIVICKINILDSVNIA